MQVGYFSGKVSWENTFHSLCNGSTKKTVSSMDPDAPVREGRAHFYLRTGIEKSVECYQTSQYNHLFEWRYWEV